MKTTYAFLLLLSAVVLTSRQVYGQSLLAETVHSDVELFQSMESNRQWPSYRGYFASGYMDNVHLPDSFHINSGHHVRWKIPISGLGLSCPVIWDDRVIVTTAVGEGEDAGYRTGLYGDIEPVEDSSVHSWRVICLNLKSGEILWDREAYRGVPQVKRHPKSSHANTTVATDGSRVVAFFGSEGLYCYSMDGKLLWKRDFGLIRSAWNVVESAEWEFSSSPVIFQDKVILQADALNTSFVAVLDLFTGKTIWRKERDEIAGWCTPNIYFDGSKARMVVNGYHHRAGYDLQTGEEIWRMAGGGDIPVPTPVVWKDLIYFNSAHGRHAPLMAIKNSSKEEIPYPETEEFIAEEFAWFYDRGGAYMTSVLVYDSLLYRLRWNGNLMCFHARTGVVIYETTISPASFIACPVAADNRIYAISEEGELFIIQAGNSYELLKMIPLGEPSLVTPAIAEGVMVLRTAGHLIAVSNE